MQNCPLFSNSKIVLKEKQLMILKKNIELNCISFNFSFGLKLIQKNILKSWQCKQFIENHKKYIWLLINIKYILIINTEKECATLKSLCPRFNVDIRLFLSLTYHVIFFKITTRILRPMITNVRRVVLTYFHPIVELFT